jgi:formate dehydrogenase subunit delta
VSASSPDRLVYMANQIAAFFVSQPGGEAGLRVADHLTSFWTPSMRRALVAHVDAGGTGLAPAGLEAVQILKASSAEGVEHRLAEAGAPSPRRQPGAAQADPPEAAPATSTRQK